MPSTTLYLVHLNTASVPDASVSADLRPLAPGWYLAASTQTRSQLYHALKRRFRPGRLLVAPLADDPKFMGMDAGALAWLRARRDTQPGGPSG
ncbi:MULTISPECIES: hypothetical protein [Luteimonas]|uniref:hypothetical protein n=1 Tax=Luteimonas TaxID=83614 RepID=UPI00117D2CDD|nr:MULTISPECIES: hypothetical protein [Luteimonas]